MKEEAHCPHCNAELGSPEDDVGITCWKCGLAFGETEATMPVIRSRWASRLLAGRVAISWFAPPLISWAIIRIYPHLPSWVPSLGVLAWVPSISLFAFTLVCLLQVIEWIAGSERNAAWLLKAVVCTAVVLLDTCLVGQVVNLLCF